MDIAEGNRRGTGLDDVPDDMVDALESPVEGINSVVVAGGMEGLPVDIERGSPDPVRDGTDAGAEEALAGRMDVFLKGVPAHDDILVIAVFVRGEQRDDAGAVIGHLEGDIAVFQGIEGDWMLIDAAVEILGRHEDRSLLGGTCGKEKEARRQPCCSFHNMHIFPQI